MARIIFEAVTKRWSDGTVAVDSLDLTVSDGELMVLVGPSGCGKSTVLRMVAGLEDATEGTIRIGDRIANELSPSDRDVAMVFQDYALYPHMTAHANIAFALRARKLGRSEIDARVRDAARLLGIEALLSRKPRALSGGERQRVAMGRALVRRPKAFLMDEPLSNLDAKMRVQMRTEIRRLHDEIATTFVYVTHDQVEAMTMGDRVAVLRRGRLQQVDTPQSTYERPANVFVAAFIGSPPMNLVEAAVDTDGAGARARFGPWSIPLPRRLGGTRDRVVVGIRPESMRAAGPAGTGGASVPAEVDVDVVEPLGAVALVHFSIEAGRVRSADGGGGRAPVDISPGPAPVVASVDGRARVAAGRRATMAIDPDHLHFFDPGTGRRL